VYEEKEQVCFLH